MSDEIDTRVTPSLHPGVVKKVDGYDEETAPILAATEEAFFAAYNGLRKVHDARELARANGAWTEAAQIINTDNLARKQEQQITRRFDKVHGDLKRGIALIEGELSSPVTTKATLQIAAEIRAHCKGLSSGSDRMNFVRSLINEGDELSASAILGGPAFLSGLNNEQLGIFTRLYHETRQPELSKRLKAMKAGLELIQTNAPLVFDQMAKAVGCPPHKVDKLRKAHTAAEKAMVFRDAN
ncbi:MAG: hypothetical protein AAF250_01775 [Pseudomonadota bacterium]